MGDGLNDTLNTLDLERIIGFNGKIWNGLLIHPNNVEIIYPLGFNVVIEEISTGKQSMLSKHTHNVTSIAINSTGKYMATGQSNFMGYKAPIIVWDYETKKPIMEKELHKVKIEALAFTSDNNYLISLGGRDCGAVVVWDLGKGVALCGSQAQVPSAGVTNCMVASMVDPVMFVTAGLNTLRVWRLNAPGRKIIPTDCRYGGGVKREVTCVQLADHKSSRPFFFCGTATGDILGINTVSCQLQILVPDRNKLYLGITVMSLISVEDDSYAFLVGTGDGRVGRYDLTVTLDKHHVHAALKQQAGVKPWMDTTLKKRSRITSIAKRGVGHMFFVGTENCQIYKIHYGDLSATLIKTCHESPINDVLFAFASSQLIITCSFETIRVWNVSGQELCRYFVYNKTCNAVCITRDGRNIFSGWDDSKVRVFGFMKEKNGTVKLYEKFFIPETHNRGVTAIAVTACGNWLITGGAEGLVRVWQIFEDLVTKIGHGVLEATMKEHKGKVTCIRVDQSDCYCVTASTDGSAIVWDLKTNTRSEIVLSNTLFKCVCYGFQGLHLLTAGTNHMIGYWEVVNGIPLRELEGAQTGAINTMDVATSNNHYITGGGDRLIRLWKYNEGSVTHVGIGHSDEILAARICSHDKLIVSCSADGAIFIWKYPSDI